MAMSDDRTPLVLPVTSPWRDTLLDALRNVQRTLLVVSPYIKEDAVTLMKQALRAGIHERSTEIEVRIITRVEPDELLNGSSDIAALQQMLSWPAELPGSTVEIRAIPNVHAKVWVCDGQLAFVGSGNATLPGLTENLEYGLATSDPVLVARILSDWQQWWEQAQRLEAAALEELARALQILKQSDEAHQAQAQNDRLKQTLRSIPHIGKRIVLSRREKQINPLVKESPGTTSTDTLDADISLMQAYTVIPAPEELREDYLSPEAISIPITDFWWALCWVLPIDETVYGMIPKSVAQDAYLKIAWKNTPPRNQTLQVIWADGKRYSQASLPAHNEALQHPWAITLNINQLRMLGEILRGLKKEQFFEKKAQQQFRLLLRTSPHELFIAYLRSPLNRESHAAMVIPCTPSSIPGSLPTLLPPISHITVLHEALQTALTSLRNERLRTHSDSTPLMIVELSFDTSASLTLSTGQIETPLIQSIAGTDCKVAGPEVRLRLDYLALCQVLASPQWNVHAWQLCVGREADTIQLTPEPGALPENGPPWQHELRHI